MYFSIYNLQMHAGWIRKLLNVWYERLYGKIIHDLLWVNYLLVETHKPYHYLQLYMSRDRRFPTMWNVRPAKPQISLRIRAVWSEPLLVACIFYDCLATDCTSFGVSKLKGRLIRLVWVYTCQNATLLEITCNGSYILDILTFIMSVSL